jgi:phage gp46-like protein
VDAALVWDQVAGAADLALTADGTDILVDSGLETDVLASLFLDRRANVDDDIPDGTTDARGWWADEHAAVPGDLIGSRRWLLDRSKRSGEVAKRLQHYDAEALAWLVDDGVAEDVTVVVTPRTPEQWAAAGASIREHGYLEEITIVRGGQPIGFRYASNWQAQFLGSV